jgi:glycerol uptake facilitator-like aquaporin
VVAEALGTMFLVTAIVGAGLQATVAGAATEVPLLAISMAAGASLIVSCLAFGAISGGHFNPAVTFVFLLRGEISIGDTIAYWIGQIVGGIVGTVLANAMFGSGFIEMATADKLNEAMWIGELLATGFLIIGILGCIQAGATGAIPFAVGISIFSAHWFTVSTSFANPAVTIARMFTGSITGIAPASAVGFIVVQFIAAAIVFALFRFLAARK